MLNTVTSRLYPWPYPAANPSCSFFFEYVKFGPCSCGQVILSALGLPSSYTPLEDAATN